MFPAATLFLDVCVQEDLWPAGSWPLVSTEQAANVERLFMVARAWPVRQGGVMCRHSPEGVPAADAAPAHCRDARTWATRPMACDPATPLRLVGADEGEDAAPLERGVAIYVDSGCAAAVPVTAAYARAFAHLAAGVRDAVVFGAGIEHAMARVVNDLLARRIRTHVAIDAAGAADDVAAQLVVADWKRRGVDVTTVAMVERMLQRN